METTIVKQKNLSLELAKLLAACFVVFIHAPFPGTLGSVVTCMARFAVPFFFAVSGYYSLGIGEKRLKKRILHLLKLHLITAVICVAMNCVAKWQSPADLQYYLRHEILPDARQWTRWLILQVNPYGGHLWYLSSLLLCYGVLLAYEKFMAGEAGKNGPLYGAGAVLLAVFLVLSTFMKMEGMDVPFKVYRNGWLLGLPMFLMGMFLHEQEERLWRNFCLTKGKLLMLMAGGLAFSLVQDLSGNASEIPVGILLLVPALLLFLQRYPRLPVKHIWVQKLVSRFGVVSTAVYLLHIAAIDVYNLFLKEPAGALLGTKADDLMPIVVLAITFLGAFAWERVDWLCHHKKSPR